MIMKPIYSGKISGKPARFFGTPARHGWAHPLWFAADDLLVALGLTVFERETLLRMRRSQYRHIFITVPTPDAVVMIAPEFVGDEELREVTKMGLVERKVYNQYTRACNKAASLLKTSRAVQ